VIGELKKAPLAKRVKSLREMQEALAVAVNDPAPTGTGRIAQLEAAIGEGLNFLQTSKMTPRSSVLQEIKKTLCDIIDRKNQVGK